MTQSVINLSGLKSLQAEIALLPKFFEINQVDVPDFYSGHIILLGGLIGSIITIFQSHSTGFNFLAKCIAHSTLTLTGAILINYQKNASIAQIFHDKYRSQVINFKDHNNNVYEASVTPIMEAENSKLFGRMGYIFEYIYDITDAVQIIETENFT